MRSSGSGGPRLGLDPRRRAPLRVERSGAPYLVPVAVALAAAIALGVGWRRLATFGATAWKSPETQVRDALANQNRAHLSDVYGFQSGGTAELFPLRFLDAAVSVDGGRATVVAMLDAEGRVTWRDEQASLRYLGRERFHLRPCPIALWCGEGDQFERLRGVLAALFRRLDAARARDAAALGPLVGARYRDAGEDRAAVLARLGREWRDDRATTRVRAWQIRVERDGAEVGEDVERTRDGQAAAARALYRLEWDGARWVFVAGL